MVLPKTRQTGHGPNIAEKDSERDKREKQSDREQMGRMMQDVCVHVKEAKGK